MEETTIVNIQTWGLLFFEIGGFMFVIGLLANNISKGTKSILRFVGLLLCIFTIIVVTSIGK